MMGDTIPLSVQQLNRDMCVMSSLASTFMLWGDLKAHDKICQAIKTSLAVLDRFEFAISTVCTSELNYYPLKFAEGVFYPLANKSPFPTLVSLCSIDGSKAHAMTICGDYIFDSNAKHPLPLVAESLDWCCGTAMATCPFSHVHRAIRFLHRKPKPCWTLHL